MKIKIKRLFVFRHEKWDDKKNSLDPIAYSDIQILTNMLKQNYPVAPGKTLILSSKSEQAIMTADYIRPLLEVRNSFNCSHHELHSDEDTCDSQKALEIVMGYNGKFDNIFVITHGTMAQELPHVFAEISKIKIKKGFEFTVPDYGQGYVVNRTKRRVEGPI